MLSESQCLAYRIETNMDYVGGDLLNEAATVRDQNGCCAACERATRCNAFTYVVETQACWLKTGRRHAQPATADERGATIVSGVRGRLKARPRLASFDGVLRLETGGTSVQGPLDSTRVQTPHSGGAVLYAARLALQQERSAQEQQVIQLLERARSRWQSTLVDVDGRPLMRLSIAPLPNVSLRGTATAWLSWTSRGAAATTWLHWPLLRQPHPEAASSAVALAVGTFRPRSLTPSWRWQPLVLRAPMREHQPDTRAAVSADEAGAAAAAGTAPDAAAEEEPEQVSEGAVGGDGGAAQDDAQDDAQGDGLHTPALRTSSFEVGAALPDVAPSLSGGHRMLVRLSARHDAASHWVHYRTISLGLGTAALGTAALGTAALGTAALGTAALGTASAGLSSPTFTFAPSVSEAVPAFSSVSALVAGGLHASAHHGAAPLENALLAEALGFRVPLLLTTSAPCAASAQSPTTSLSSSADESVRTAADDAMGEERGPLSASGRRERLSLEERCLHCLAPLLRAVALMPAAGRDEHTRERRCGRDWVARWSPGPPGATMFDPVAPASSDSSAASVSSTTSCDPNAPHTPPPLVLFARGPVAFMALSAALSLRAHSSARRTAVAARGAGADWVVAYGEAADGSIGGPSGEDNGHVREEEVRGLADVLIYSTNAANATTRAVVRSTALGGTLVILRSDEYARLYANRTAMAIERVRAADGRVLETLVFRKRRAALVM